MKNISDLDIREKKVLIRVDFNVPMDEQGNITDDTRIRGVLPTINYALDEHAKVIIMSHLGRPDGQRQEKFSRAPVAKRLSRLLDKEIMLAPDCIGPEVDAMVAGMNPGDILRPDQYWSCQLFYRPSSFPTGAPSMDRMPPKLDWTSTPTV